MVLFSERVKNEFNLLKDKDRLYIQLIKWALRRKINLFLF
jgi:hypothetical protein